MKRYAGLLGRAGVKIGLKALDGRELRFIQGSFVALIARQCIGFRIKLRRDSEVQHEECRGSGVLEMVCCLGVV